MKESKRIIAASGPRPDVILFRYCPTSPFHWRSADEKCPVCKAKIEVVRYVPEIPETKEEKGAAEDYASEYNKGEDAGRISEVDVDGSKPEEEEQH
jgi:hypothetical protein